MQREHNIQGLHKRLVQAARESGYISSRAAARAAGITESAWSFYASGARQPSLESIVKIATAFRVSSDWLLGIQSDRERQENAKPYT